MYTLIRVYTYIYIYMHTYMYMYRYMCTYIYLYSTHHRPARPIREARIQKFRGLTQAGACSQGVNSPQTQGSPRSPHPGILHCVDSCYMNRSNTQARPKT